MTTLYFPLSTFYSLLSTLSTSLTNLTTGLLLFYSRVVPVAADTELAEPPKH
jgi:hypothetical protein